jgi:hypothetical protein
MGQSNSAQKQNWLRIAMYLQLKNPYVTPQQADAQLTQAKSMKKRVLYEDPNFKFEAHILLYAILQLVLTHQLILRGVS